MYVSVSQILLGCHLLDCSPTSLVRNFFLFCLFSSDVTYHILFFPSWGRGVWAVLSNFGNHLYVLINSVTDMKFITLIVKLNSEEYKKKKYQVDDSLCFVCFFYVYIFISLVINCACWISVLALNNMNVAVISFFQNGYVLQNILYVINVWLLLLLCLSSWFVCFLICLNF